MSKYNKKLVASIAGIGVLALVLASCSNGDSSTFTVNTAQVEIGKFVKHVEFSGVLAPNQTASIYTKLSGQAKQVNADVGNMVNEGEVLVVIDSKELNAQLAVTEAAESSVRDQAEQAKIGIATAKANLDLAQKSFERMNSLFETKSIPQSQLDDASTKQELAKRAYENAQTQYQLLSSSSLAQAQAQANLIRVQIGNSIVKSPIPGVVTNRNINVGELANPAAPLMTVADTSQLRLQGNVSQDAVALLVIGQKVVVSIDGIANADYEGRITQIGPVAASTGQYFPIVVSLKNTGKLLAGMTALARFDIEAKESLIVPKTAVQSSEGQYFAYIVVNGRAERHQIGIGLQDESSVQILSGLTQGQAVVSSDVDALKDGLAVEVRE